MTKSPAKINWDEFRKRYTLKHEEHRRRCDPTSEERLEDRVVATVKELRVYHHFAAARLVAELYEKLKEKH